MAIVKVSDILDTPTLSDVPLDGSTALLKNSIVYRDTSNGVLKAASATVSDATNVMGVVPEAVESGATVTDVIPFAGCELQEWEVDCTNNTAANQLLKAHLMTDSVTVNNTSTHSTDINAIFIATKIVGAAGDKKLRGWFAKTGQVTA